MNLRIFTVPKRRNIKHLPNKKRKLQRKSSSAANPGKGISVGIDITEGVLQGETLSPFLLALFISDLELFLRERGVNGISFKEVLKLILLAFADDIVIFADTSEGMTRIFVALLEYCNLKKLTVNTSKTNVVKKDGRNPNLKFFFGNKRIDIVKDYKYLEIVFDKSGLFREVANNHKDKYCLFGNTGVVKAQVPVRLAL